MHLLQLDKMANNGLHANYYDRQIISWAVLRMRPDNKHLQIDALGGTLVVRDAGHGHSSVEGSIMKESCLLHITLPVEDNDSLESAEDRMLGMAFYLGRDLRGAKTIEWVGPYGPYA